MFRFLFKYGRVKLFRSCHDFSFCMKWTEQKKTKSELHFGLFCTVVVQKFPPSKKPHGEFVSATASGELKVLLRFPLARQHWCKIYLCGQDLCLVNTKITRGHHIFCTEPTVKCARASATAFAYLKVFKLEFSISRQNVLEANLCAKEQGDSEKLLSRGSKMKVGTPLTRTGHPG